MPAQSPHVDRRRRPLRGRRRVAWWRSALHDQHGVAAVEFAILLPVLCAILLGMIDYGYYFFLNSTVVNAAREGARAGVVMTDDGAAIERARAVATTYLAAANIDVGSCFNCASVEPTYDVTENTLAVTVSVDPYSPLTGFLPDSALPALATHTSTMRVEGFLP